MFLFVFLVFCLGVFVGWKYVPSDFPPQSFERIGNKAYITYMYRRYVAKLDRDGLVCTACDIASIDPGYEPGIMRQIKIKELWRSHVLREEYLRDKAALEAKAPSPESLN